MPFTRPSGLTQLVLPFPPAAYDPTLEAYRNLTLTQADAKNRKIGAAVDLGTDTLILTAPDGTRHALAVSNAGALSTVVVA